MDDDIIHRMTPDYIRTLIDYNYWARDPICASAEKPFPDMIAFFGEPSAAAGRVLSDPAARP